MAPRNFFDFSGRYKNRTIQKVLRKSFATRSNIAKLVNMTARSVNIKQSFQSLTGANHNAISTLLPDASRQFRPCSDCTCSPGLLSRQNRRSSLFLRKISNSKRNSQVNPLRMGQTSSESVYSCDTICQVKNINTSKRLLRLREKMSEHDLCCYIVPSEDEHQSEYVSQADQRRSFISGFTGSAGVACITRDLLNFNSNVPEGKSIISTDGRYFNQALQELDFNWSLIRQGVDPLTWQQWCINESFEMSKGLGGKLVRIGIDPKLITHQQVKNFNQLINKKILDDADVKIEFVPIPENLVDAIWAEFEPVPVRDSNELLLLDLDISGEEFKSKRERLVKYFREKYSNDNHFCVVALDEICWILNLRGSDIEYNPVFYAYLLFSGDSTILFTDNQYGDKVSEYFQDNKITVKPYKAIWDELRSEAKILANNKDKILVPNNSSWEMVRNLDIVKYDEIQSPIELFKSIKNDTEIKNAQKAQVKDAVCLVEYFSWLEEQLVVKEKLIDEYKAAQKLNEIRKLQEHFMGNSFETISSSGANAAVIHYSPPEENASMVDPSKLYLCDSGAQFIEGTTDITRTLHFKEPTQEEIDHYTLVLKGNLALERLIIPEGTTGFSIDVIARQFLWQHGLDYRHGTGHGVGSFLNVHEGPIGIGYRPTLANFPLKKGNIVTNEPGYYKDGEYGIRIENDMLVKEAEGLKFGEQKFLKFENMTLVPYCRKLINVKMLSKEEKQQINDYHAKIWSTIVPFIQTPSVSYKWLKREVTPL